ncbi:MAG: radical SAM protein [Chloroflexota bacterium]|nr:radical SAM protein [Chloroflexota bacterium]
MQVPIDILGKGAETYTTEGMLFPVHMVDLGRVALLVFSSQLITRSISGTARRIGLRASRRHAYAFMRYSTGKKLRNLARANLEYRMHRSHVQSLPFVLNVEPINACNLKCPLCPTGAGEYGRPKSRMDMDGFRGIIDTMGDYLYEVNLFNFGEPLLNKELPSMVAYANKRGISTCVSTNATLLDAGMTRSLIEAKLDYLILSIDGISKETYGQYRVGGDFGMVIENVRRIVAEKSIMDVTAPFIEWQFLVFKHNQHEIQAVPDFTRSLGVDGVCIKGASASTDLQDRDNSLHLRPNCKEGKQYHEDTTGNGKPCDLLWFTMTVNNDGGLSPCCLAYKEENDFANIFKSEYALRDIWNNIAFTSARSIFLNRHLPSDIHLLCNDCHIVKDYLTEGP